MQRVAAALYYRVHNHLSEVEMPENVGDFRLMDRQVVDAARAARAAALHERPVRVGRLSHRPSNTRARARRSNSPAGAAGTSRSKASPASAPCRCACGPTSASRSPRCRSSTARSSSRVRCCSATRARLCVADLRDAVRRRHPVDRHRRNRRIPRPHLSRVQAATGLSRAARYRADALVVSTRRGTPRSPTPRSCCRFRSGASPARRRQPAVASAAVARNLSVK